MSLNVKVITDISAILSQEIKKYEGILHAEVSKVINRLDIDQMIREITTSIISQNINQVMHEIISENQDIHRLTMKKLKESIEGMNIQNVMQEAAGNLIKEALHDKYESDY